jgi:hypothetical protein
LRHKTQIAAKYRKSVSKRVVSETDKSDGFLSLPVVAAATGIEAMAVGFSPAFLYLSNQTIYSIFRDARKLSSDIFLKTVFLQSETALYR